MGGVGSSALLRCACAGLLAAGLVAATALTATALTVGGTLTQMASGSAIEHASVKATIAGTAAPVSAQPPVQKGRVAHFLIDTSGLGRMQMVVRTTDAFLAGVPKNVYVGVDLAAAQSQPSALASLTASIAPVMVARPNTAATTTGPYGIAWLLWVALLAVFLGLLGVVGAILAPTYVSRRKRRVESMQGYVATRGPSPEDERSTVAAISASLISLGDKVMESRSSTPRTQRMLERADLPLRVGEWAVIRALAFVVGLVGGMFLMRGGSVSTFIGAILGGLAGFILPALFLKFAASRRSAKFESQLPDVLTLVASSLATGFSLLQALDAVARDAADPSAKEFSRALAETRIGADLSESLDHLADRMESQNLRWTAMAIDIQRQVGGNLAETLRNTAATLRDRQALKRHVNALAAEGKLSAYILIAMPIGIFAYMTFANKPYVELLWTTVIGIGMLAAAVISMLFGIFWMSKVVKVEV